METSFFIDLSIKTVEGHKSFGSFQLGADRDAARSLFKKLKGSPSVDEKDMLYVEFRELVNGLPVNIDILTCDLQELGTNCMLITQEVFRLSNLKTG